MTRPSWDDTLFAMAEILKDRATCPRFQTASIIVNPDREILSVGYNGAPQGFPHCSEIGCAVVDGHCLWSVHSEANSLMSTLSMGRKVSGAIMYVLGHPCPRCALLIVRARLSEVRYRGDYANNDLNYLSKDILGQAGIVLSYCGPRKDQAA